MPGQIDQRKSEFPDGTFGNSYGRGETDWPKPGTEYELTDAGILLDVPGVQGAYVLPDVNALNKFRRAPG